MQQIFNTVNTWWLTQVTSMLQNLDIHSQ